MSSKKIHPEYQYLNLLREVLEASYKDDRTGVGTYSVFGRQMRFDLSQGFPLLTTKKVFLRAIIYELLWFLQGDTNIRYLVDNNVHIWDEWPYQKYTQAQQKNSHLPKLAQKDFVEKIKNDSRFARKWGDLGPVYGAQWRRWKTAEGKEIDQISAVIEQIKHNPNSRRIIVNAWNVAYIDQMALPPCHTLFQFYVKDGALSCQLYQRSGDLFLGVPFNIASYALLLMMVAHVARLKVGEFVHTLGDAHIYKNHIEQVKVQLLRTPRPLPTMRLPSSVQNIFDFAYDSFQLENYDPYPAIKAPVAV